jgi:hypothetical protein
MREREKGGRLRKKEKGVIPPSLKTRKYKRNSLKSNTDPGIERAPLLRSRKLVSQPQRESISRESLPLFLFSKKIPPDSTRGLGN